MFEERVKDLEKRALQKQMKIPADPETELGEAEEEADEEAEIEGKKKGKHKKTGFRKDSAAGRTVRVKGEDDAVEYEQATEEEDEEEEREVKGALHVSLYLTYP